MCVRSTSVSTHLPSCFLSPYCDWCWGLRMLYIMSGGGRGQEDSPELPVPSPSPAQPPSTPAQAHEELGYYGYHSHLVSIYRISVRKAQKQLVIKCKAQRYGCVLQNVNKNNLVTCSILMQVRTTPPSLVLNKVHCTQHIVHNSQVSLICWFWFRAIGNGNRTNSLN